MPEILHLETEEVEPSSETVIHPSIQETLPSSWLQHSGEGIKVAVIDTGYSDHANLNGAYSKTLSVMGDTGLDILGHGSHVAGIIGARGYVKNGLTGFAPGCEIISIKAVPGTWASLSNAMEMAIDEGVDIINLSCGANFPPGSYFMGLVNDAVDRGTIIVASAGNVKISGKNTLNYPAKLENIIPVAAITQNMETAPFSATGSELNDGYCMPGIQVYSTWLHQRYAKCSGTSMAAPQLTGLIARILGKHLIDQGSTPIPDKGRRRLEAVLSHLDYASRNLGDPMVFGKGYIDASKL